MKTLRTSKSQRLVSSLRLVPIFVVVVACSAPPPQPPASSPIAAATAETTAATDEPSELTNPLRVELRAPPTRVRWVAATLGPAKPTLGIYVANESTAASVDVSQLHVQLSAVREGVPFRCKTDVGPSSDLREPSVLRPKSAFLFERALDCGLPLTGDYAVRVSVTFGASEHRVSRELRSFTLRVSAPEHAEPQSVKGIPGLWASIGASSWVGGSAPSGQIAIALVNGGSSIIELPTLRLALRVYRAGASIPCEDEPIDVKAPRFLSPGAEHRVPIPVSCLGLGRAGKYEVAARLLIGGGMREVEVGRLSVEVSTDPTRGIPLW